uniref:Exonuclease domain-containing protein n=1 Tax=Strongyloides venezuelensis TaxID=75913 RepID=A0A0K0EVF6_STRVS
MDSEDTNNDQSSTNGNQQSADNNQLNADEDREAIDVKEVTSIDTHKNGKHTSLSKDGEKDGNGNRNDEEKYVESEFTKKYAYLVPSNDSVYGIHSYCQDYTGYQGYFDYSALQYGTTPYNLYTATFAGSDNSNDNNGISNNSNEYNDDYFNSHFDREECSIQRKLDDVREEILQEDENVDEGDRHFFNHSPMDCDKEVSYSIPENGSDSETRKRQHPEEVNEYEPLRKKSDIGVDGSHTSTLLEINDIEYLGVDEDKEKRRKSGKKHKSTDSRTDENKRISSGETGKNKEKPIDIGNKLSQEMDISSILGTDISMGVSAAKTKAPEEIAKEPETRKDMLKLKSSKKILPKPRIKVFVSKDSKDSSGGDNGVQYCDEKKTLIKISGAKIGIIDRKKLYLQLFNGLKQQGVNEEDARKLATKKEYNCALEAADTSKYKSKCYNEIMKIKKRDCSPFVDKNAKKLEFSDVDVRKFHEYLQEYILTEEQLKDNDYPRRNLESGEVCVYEEKGTLSQKSYYAPPNENQRVCCRCSKIFQVSSSSFEPTKKEVICIYHSEKLMYDFARRNTNDKTFNCCGGSNDTVGCKEGDEHVTITQPHSNLKLFKETPHPLENDNVNGVYALDCEMILTVAGQDVARVTVVDMNCQVVYDQLVKPKYRVTDYRTQYSGITEQLLKTNSLPLEEVQEKLFEMFNKDTILIGHSLNCDLEALKLIHKNVVDTSVTFPHRNPQFKNPLRKLAKLYINMDIQDAHTGHDSAEDAIAAMRLLIAKYQGKI